MANVNWLEYLHLKVLLNVLLGMMHRHGYNRQVEDGKPCAVMVQTFCSAAFDNQKDFEVISDKQSPCEVK